MGRLREEGGQSIVEVTVAVFILAACVLPLASAFDAALGASGRAGDHDAARLEAHRAVETLRALGYREAASRYEPGPSAVCPGFEPGGRTVCTLRTEFVDERLQKSEADTGRLLVRVSVAVKRGGETTEREDTALLAAEGP